MAMSGVGGAPDLKKRAARRPAIAPSTSSTAATVKKPQKYWVCPGHGIAHQASHDRPWRISSRAETTNTPAIAPMTAPRAIRWSLTVISSRASSISSRTISCARSVTSSSASVISFGVPVGSLVAKALEDHRDQQAARERGADLHLRAFEGRLGLWRRSVHSGGSSSNTRCQIIAAVRCTAMDASAPSPASRPDQSSRFERSSLIERGVLSRAGVETFADGLHDEGPRLIELLGHEAEDPPGEHLLDRAVEAQRGELRRDVGAELPARLALGHDRGDERVGLADLGQVRAPERVRRARDLNDDDLHQVGVVAVGVHDEAGDAVELGARGAVAVVRLADHVEHDVPALEEQRVEHGLL